MTTGGPGRRTQRLHPLQRAPPNAATRHLQRHVFENSGLRLGTKRGSTVGNPVSLWLQLPPPNVAPERAAMSQPHVYASRGITHRNNLLVTATRGLQPPAAPGGLPLVPGAGPRRSSRGCVTRGLGASASPKCEQPQCHIMQCRDAPVDPLQVARRGAASIITARVDVSRGSRAAAPRAPRIVM